MINDAVPPGVVTFWVVAEQFIEATFKLLITCQSETR
jgi:hypothetical protein